MDQNNPTQSPPIPPPPGGQQPTPPQPSAPAGVVPPTLPASPAPQGTQPNASKRKLFLLFLVILALAVIGVIFAYVIMMNGKTSMEMGVTQDTMQQAESADVMLPEEEELDSIEVTDPATELQEVDTDAATL